MSIMRTFTIIITIILSACRADLTEILPDITSPTKQQKGIFKTTKINEE